MLGRCEELCQGGRREREREREREKNSSVAGTIIPRKQIPWNNVKFASTRNTAKDRKRTNTQRLKEYTLRNKHAKKQSMYNYKCIPLNTFTFTNTFLTHGMHFCGVIHHHELLCKGIIILLVVYPPCPSSITAVQQVDGEQDRNDEQQNVHYQSKNHRGGTE